MRDDLLQCYFCGAFKYIVKDAVDSEDELKLLGEDIGRRMILIQDFTREADIDSLIYKITYTLLPNFYETERIIEKSDDDKENTYFLYESSPVFSRYSSNTDSFCADALMAGVIEEALRCSGFESKVTAYNLPNPDQPNRVVYVIKMINDEPIN